MDAKSETRDSLFERTGRIICGERFVGRHNEIDEIKKHVIDNRANVAVVGLPRIGKSSLAWQSLMYCKQNLISDKKIIPIYIDVSTIRSNVDFFRRMVNKAIRELSSIYKNNISEVLSKDDYDYLTNQSRECIKSDEDGGIDDNNSFYAFFEDFHQLTGFKIVYIFDEFDKVQSIFHAPDFMLLRETAYTPETNLSYLTISRKSIKEIETKDKQNLSNFHGTFNKYIYLNVFSKDDIQLYWDRINSVTHFSEATKNEIISIAGYHPLLLDLCCLELISNPNIALLDSVSLREKLYDEFGQVVDMLKEKDLLSTAKQVIIGPPRYIDRQKIDKLLDFGFIRIVSSEQKSEILSTVLYTYKDDDAYVLFSDYFSQLFFFKFFLDIDYWPQWNQTENKLREIVEFFCEYRYGKKWANVIKQENDNDSDWISGWNILYRRFTKNRKIYFNSRISSPIIVAETGELYFLFIKKYWNLWFSKIFNKIKDSDLVFSNTTLSRNDRSWDEVFGFLMKIRRPYAHSNNYILSQEDEIIAKGYCELVLNKIKEWENSGLKPEKLHPEGLKDGNYYEGFVIQYGPYLSIQCDQQSYPLPIISMCEDINIGDKVIFKAISEPHKRDSSKKYWKADDVYLKEN